MEPLNLITAKETATRELKASGVEVLIRISGHSLFTGREAFKKADEVADCVKALKECGLTEDDIRISNVNTNVQRGIISKSSGATYILNVTCQDLSQLGPIVSAVSSQKNAALDALRWKYNDLERLKEEAVREAAQRARAFAEAIASSLGVRITGLHKLSYEFHDPERPQRFPQGTRLADAVYFSEQDIKHRASSISELSFQHLVKLAATVTAEFFVGTVQESG